MAPSTAPSQKPQDDAAEKLTPEQETIKRLEEVRDLLEDAGAKGAIEQHIALVTKDGENHKENAITGVEKAAQLAYDEAVHSDVDAMKVVDDHLDEIRKDLSPVLGPLRLDITVNEAGKIEVVQRTPKTNMEDLSQRFSGAMQKLKEANAIDASTPEGKQEKMEKTLEAAMELFGLAMEFVEKFQNGTLTKAFNSPETKDAKEASARRKDIVDRMAKGDSIGDIRTEKTTEKGVIDGKVTSAKGDMDKWTGEVKTIQGELAATPPPTGPVLTALNTQLNTAQESLVKAQKAHAEAKAEQVKVDAYLKELDLCETELKVVADKIAGIVKAVATADMATATDPRLKALATAITNGALTTEVDPATSRIVMKLDGKPFGQAVTDAGLDTSGMPMDAQGAITDNAAFVQFMEGTLIERTQKAAAETVAAIKESVAKAAEADLSAPQKEAIGKALEDPGGHIDFSGGFVTYVGGNIYYQANDGENASVLNTNDSAQWDVKERQYFNGKEIVQIPHADDAANGEKLRTGLYHPYNPETMEWKPKPAAEVMEDIMDDLPEQMKIALGNSGNWKTEAGGAGDIAGPADIYYDGEQTVYIQSADGKQMQTVDLSLTSVENTLKTSVVSTEKYFNGKEPVDVPDQVKAGSDHAHEYVDHVWQPRSNASCMNLLISSGFEFKEEVYRSAAKACLEGDDGFGTVGNLVMHFNGENLYAQYADGKGLRRFDFDAFRESTDGGGNFWEDVPGQSLGPDGALIAMPENTTNYEYRDHAWELDANRGIDNLNILYDTTLKKSSIQEGLQSLMEATSWQENVQFPNYEGIRDGTKIYVQAKENPTKLFVADLEEGTYEQHDGKIRTTAGEEVDVPGIQTRGSYDTETRTWGELTPDQAASRETMRIQKGEDALKTLGVSYEKRGDAEFAIKLRGDRDKMLVRFLDVTQTWQYKPDGSDLLWRDASKGLTTETMDWWDSNTGNIETHAIHQARQILQNLASVSTLQLTGTERREGTSSEATEEATEEPEDSAEAV